MNLTLAEIQDTSAQRCVRWHPRGLEQWSTLEWTGCVAGEAGEACNAAKKLKRLEDELVSINDPTRSYVDEEAAKEAIAQETADTILYAVLVFSRIGRDAERYVRQAFNQKSIEYGFPERL